MGLGKLLTWAAAVAAAPVTGGASVVAAAIGTAATSSLAESLVDNVFRDPVVPVPGSILHCALFGVEHTGVYLGKGLIVELQGSGHVSETTPWGFINGTNAVTVYVACAGTQPLGGAAIARRAKKQVSRSRDYNLLLDNCHQFTSGCLSGDFENSDNFFWMVEMAIEKHLNHGQSITWRAWAREGNDFKV